MSFTMEALDQKLYGNLDIIFIEPIPEKVENRSEKQTRPVRLSPHTFYAEPIYDLTIPHGMWEGYLQLRNTHPERKWFMVAKALDAHRPNAYIGLVNVHDNVGSDVQVSSDERVLRMLTQLTAKDTSLNVVPAHSHPIEGLSEGDRRTVTEIYNYSDGAVNVSMIVSPRAVRVYNVEVAGRGYRISEMKAGENLHIVTNPYHQSNSARYVGSRIIGILKEQNGISTEEALRIVHKW